MNSKLDIDDHKACYNFTQKIARKWFYKFNGPDNPAFDLHDLIQTGMEALHAYVQQNPFDGESGVQFQTYAYKRVNGAIIDYILSAQQVRIPKSQRIKLQQLKNAERVLMITLSPDVVTDEELAETLKTTVAEIADRRLMMPIYEAFGTQADHEATTLGDDPLASDERQQLAHDVHQCRQKIKANKKHFQDILIMDAWASGATLAHLAEVFDMAIETARRRKNSALEKMKRCLENKEWTLADVVILGTDTNPFYEEQ